MSDVVQPHQLEKFHATLQGQHKSLTMRPEAEETEIQKEEERLNKRKHTFEADKSRKKRYEQQLKETEEGLEGLAKFQKAVEVYKATEREATQEQQGEGST